MHLLMIKFHFETSNTVSMVSAYDTVHTPNAKATIFFLGYSRRGYILVYTIWWSSDGLIASSFNQ